jgi:hypothetical protein
MAELSIYTVEVNGYPATLQLTEEDAKKRGLTAADKIVDDVSETEDEREARELAEKEAADKAAAEKADAEKEAAAAKAARTPANKAAAASANKGA